MVVYKFRAKNGPGEVIEDNIEAISEKEAIEKIIQMGYIPVRVEECISGSELKASPGLSGSFMKRIGSREITIFSRQLSSLLKSGVPILAAINIISGQSENQRLKEVLHNIYNDVKDGATFSSALSKFPNMFSPLYIAMIRSGEDSGALPEVLLRITDYRAKQEEMISRIRMAMAYPILMAIVGVATVIFMLTFVMPRLMRIFINLGQDLPLPTRILISVSRLLRQWWLWVLLAVLILIIRIQTKKESMRSSLSVLKLRLPILGRLAIKTELSRFCRTLELLIKNGIPILKAIEIAIPVINNELIKNQLRQSYKTLEQGGSLGKSLKDSRFFPSFVSNLITVGEESGKLDDALGEVASSYERDTDETIKVMSSLMEPLMILAMGLIIGFIVIAMLLPIFEINLSVR